MTVTLLIVNRFSRKIFTGRFSSKCAVKYLLKIRPHIICVAVLTCETLMSENEHSGKLMQ